MEKQAGSDEGKELKVLGMDLDTFKLVFSLSMMAKSIESPEWQATAQEAFDNCLKGQTETNTEGKENFLNNLLFGVAKIGDMTTYAGMTLMAMLEELRKESSKEVE